MINHLSNIELKGFINLCKYCTAKITALSSGKTDIQNILQGKKYYLLIKVEWYCQVRLLIFLPNVLEKQAKKIEDQGRKQAGAIMNQREKLVG